MKWPEVEFRDLQNVRAEPNIRRYYTWPRTVISQYVNSPRINELLRLEELEIDPWYDFLRFYDDVFNLDTAKAWGLDVWGRIVGIGRQIELEGISDAFGFDGSALLPFDQGPFWTSTVTSTYLLADEAFRMLIYCKAAMNVSDGTLASLNRLFNMWFGHKGVVCVLHVGTMYLRVFFDFYLEQYERAMLAREDVPPIPAGVGFDIYEAPRAELFGFDGSELNPFDNGIFSGGPYYAYSF